MHTESTSTLTERLLSFAGRHQLFQRNDLIVVAISGGVDSVVLAHLLHQLGQPMLLAHCNFQLRGSESENDEKFVRTMAKEWQLPLVVKDFDTATYATAKSISIQEAARELRYAWFAELRHINKPDNGRALTALAHHADDQVETMLNNLFRGGGLKNLMGMPVKREGIIRPLLFASRSEIEAYATANALVWVDDSTNAKTDYTRNLIRHEILPAIGKVYPGVNENLLHTQAIVQEASLLYDEAVSTRLKRLLEYDEKLQPRVSIRKLLKESPLRTMVFELFRRFGFSPAQVGEILKLCHAVNGGKLVGTSHRIIRHGNWLLLVPLHEQEVLATIVVIDQLPANTIFPNGLLSIKPMDDIPDDTTLKQSGNNTVYVDAAMLRMPLVLRPWKQGDYFFPLGMRKKKKLARLFIDLKIPAHEKEKVWVLEADSRIVWVVGIRVDDRFAIGMATKKSCRLTYIPSLGNK